MFTNLKHLGLAAVLSLLAMATPVTAEARDHYRYHDNDGAVLAAGVVGLALGVALASDRDDGYYYEDRGYYRGSPGYSYEPYPRGYYRNYRRDYWRGDRGWYREYRHHDRDDDHDRDYRRYDGWRR